MINKVILIGNLGRDPEIRVLENGASVAKFPMATNENYQDQSGEWQTITEWHNVVLWRRLAERAERTLSKGKLVYVEGKISTRKWTDQEGNDRYTTEIVARTFRLLERRDTDSNFDNSFPSPEDESMSGKISSPSSSSFEKNAKEISKEINDVPADDDDLPF